MRKELKSKSRRKWLIGGSLAFASVALLTTGFATWVIGTSKPSGDGQVHIGVDTAQDNSVELTFSLDENDNGIFVTEDADTVDWNIKIKDLNVVVGEDFYNSLKAKQEEKQKVGQDLNLKISFELQKDVAAKDDKNVVTKDIVGVRGGQTESSWKYITLVNSELEVKLPSTYPSEDGKIGKIYDINDTLNNPDKTFSFTWGSYFGDKAPSKFYEERRGSQNSGEYYKKALQELQEMKTALTADKGTLNLTATFVYEK